MKLPNLRRIYANDFAADYQDLITNLSNSLNINLEFLYQGFNKNVSLRDNIACTVKEITVTVDADGVPTNPIAFARDTNLPVIGAEVINAINLTNSTAYPTGQPFIAYTLNNDGRFVIRYISSLTAGNNYRLTVVIWN